MRSCPVHSWGWTNLDRQGVPGVITRKKCCHILKLSRLTISPLSSKLKSNLNKVFEIKNFKYILGLKKMHYYIATKTLKNLIIQELQEPNCIPLIVWIRYSQPECFKRLTCEFLMRSCPVHSWGWTNLDRQGVPGVITRKKCCHFLKLSRFTISPLTSKLKSSPNKVFEIIKFKYVYLTVKENASLFRDEKL